MSRQRIALTITLAALVAASWPTWNSWAALNTVAGLFEGCEYGNAADALAEGGEGTRPGEEILWRSRLAKSPSAALELLAPLLTDDRLDPPVRVRAVLESAELHAGRGEHGEALRILGPLLGEASPDLPGAVYFRAGLSLRAVGRLQHAREMLASVRPQDPAFIMARFQLGDIALEQDDPVLARRYFDAAASAGEAATPSLLAAGRWRAFRATGDDEAAAALVDELGRTDPGSLALLEIRRRLQVAADEARARTVHAAGNTVATRPDDQTGRYALQLGAFSDRALALEFQRRHAAQLPDLRIDKTRDARGQFLYKVRTGSYVNPALARTDARALARRLGLEVIVAELAADGGRRTD